MKKQHIIVLAVSSLMTLGFFSVATTKAANSGITVISPKAGDVMQCPGPTYPIQWTNTTGKSVVIEFDYGGDFGEQLGPFGPEVTSTDFSPTISPGNCWFHLSDYQISAWTVDATGKFPDFTSSGASGTSGNFTINSAHGKELANTSSDVLIPIDIILIGLVLYEAFKMKKSRIAVWIWWLATGIYCLALIPILQIIGEGFLLLVGLPIPLGIIFDQSANVLPLGYLFYGIGIAGVVLSFIALKKTKWSSRWTFVFIALSIIAIIFSYLNINAGTCDINIGDSIYLACNYGLLPTLPNFSTSIVLLCSALVLYKNRRDGERQKSRPEAEPVSPVA